MLIKASLCFFGFNTLSQAKEGYYNILMREGELNNILERSSAAVCFSTNWQVGGRDLQGQGKFTN